MTKGKRVGARETRSRPANRLRQIFRASGMVPALVAVLVIGSFVSPAFLTVINFSTVLKFTSVIGLLAVGQTFVILSGRGGIDLSVGSVLAVSGVTGALFQEYGLGAIIVASVAAGGFFGIINGLGVTKARLQPFIVTLATMTIASGLAFYLSKAAPVWLDVPGLADIQGGAIGPVPMPIVIFAFVAVIATLFLRYTVYGRELYAIGGNDEASHLSGIPGDRRRLLVYALSGVLAGFAAVMLMSFTQTADPNAGFGYELQSIAAVVVGGTPLSGGVGSVVGTTVGVLIIAFVSNILILVNVSPWMQQMFTGFIVLAAVAIEAKRTAGDVVTAKEKLKQLAPLIIWLAFGIAIVAFVLTPMT